MLCALTPSVTRYARDTSPIEGRRALAFPRTALCAFGH